MLGGWGRERVLTLRELPRGMTRCGNSEGPYRPSHRPTLLHGEGNAEPGGRRQLAGGCAVRTGLVCISFTVTSLSFPTYNRRWRPRGLVTFSWSLTQRLLHVGPWAGTPKPQASKSPLQRREQMSLCGGSDGNSLRILGCPLAGSATRPGPRWWLPQGPMVSVSPPAPAPSLHFNWDVLSYKLTPPVFSLYGAHPSM